MKPPRTAERRRAPLLWGLLAGAAAALVLGLLVHAAVSRLDADDRLNLDRPGAILVWATATVVFVAVAARRPK
jgi:high-affinity Fe2+/Pb2+ permease